MGLLLAEFYQNQSYKNWNHAAQLTKEQFQVFINPRRVQLIKAEFPGQTNLCSSKGKYFDKNQDPMKWLIKTNIILTSKTLDLGPSFDLKLFESNFFKWNFKSFKTLWMGLTTIGSVKSFDKFCLYAVSHASSKSSVFTD